jgi:hypothetical protein
MKPSRGVPKPGQARKGVKTAEGPIWFEASRLRLVHGNVKSLCQQDGLQVICNRLFSVSLTKWQRTHHCGCSLAIMSKRSEDAKRFKSEVKQFWDITDHGPIDWFLGL